MTGILHARAHSWILENDWGRSAWLDVWDRERGVGTLSYSGLASGMADSSLLSPTSSAWIVSAGGAPLQPFGMSLGRRQEAQWAYAE